MEQKHVQQPQQQQTTQVCQMQGRHLGGEGNLWTLQWYIILIIPCKYTTFETVLLLQKQYVT